MPQCLFCRRGSSQIPLIQRARNESLYGQPTRSDPQHRIRPPRQRVAAAALWLNDNSCFFQAIVKLPCEWGGHLALGLLGTVGELQREFAAE